MAVIFNTLSGKKENLPSTQGRPLRLFVCGPTVYDNPHIGHARTYIVFDAFVNYLKSRKIPVFYLQNITDVDDKIISRAREKKISPVALAKQYEKIYHQDEKSLNIKAAKYARASAHIPEIIKQIQTLIEKGYAYKIENSGYYFNISKFPDYGKLSKRTALQAEDATSRIDEGMGKKNKGDFALWKFPDDLNIPAPKNQNKILFKIINGEPLWHTPLGWGRPGWHIEDTAITEKYFGPQYDIHGGAVDLKFPHHEAEIAQQESASGKKPLVKIWMHAGFLLINGEKMSKSLGNFLTIQDFLKSYSPNALRYIILSHHYRSPINYTDQLAKDAQKSLNHIAEFIMKLSLIKNISLPVKIEIGKYDNAFYSALDDDFNTPQALAQIFNLINDVNPLIWKISKADALSVKKWLLNKLKLLKINISMPKIPAQIKLLAKERKLCRDNKQFAQSDLLRKKIEALGYNIEDAPAGTIIFPKL